MTMVRFSEIIEITSSPVPVYETKPGAIIVPGLSGMVETVPVLKSSLANPLPDAHAHILMYGMKMQLVLDGSNSIEGPSVFSYTVLHVRPNVQRSSQGSRLIFVAILKLPTIQRYSSKAWGGTRTDGNQSGSRRL